MIVLRNAQSLFKRVRISHQAFLLTACKRPKLKDNPTFASKPLSFWGKWLQNTSLKKI
ncbi:hypothetical protein [Helicobacter pylori]|uniref:hypothetical protein n=1 Tax=Helicobacter pylori TaxID=210 RepID=UPI0013CE206B|nr:hypothetical protein [Helicobacter pylori]